MNANAVVLAHVEVPIACNEPKSVCCAGKVEYVLKQIEFLLVGALQVDIKDSKGASP